MSTIDRDPFAHSPVFGVLDEDDRASLAERSRRVDVDKGQVVICEGEASDSVLVLLSGQMKVVTYSQDGDEFILNTVVPGDTVGEIGVLSGGPRSATVRATEKSTVLTLSRSAIVEIIEERPALAVVLLEQLSNMVNRVTGVAADLVHLDLSQRVAKYLLQKTGGRAGGAGGAGGNSLGVTQSELAASVGASRQRVNNCLQEFQRNGWIDIEARRLTVRDRAALEGVVGD
jgi:CRP/FNR family transcriptional regulator, cyclic AMP receptor protein